MALNYTLSIYSTKKYLVSFKASNALRVAAINSIGSFVLFLGKIVVVIATGVISYYILKV